MKGNPKIFKVSEVYIELEDDLHEIAAFPSTGTLNPKSANTT